MHEGFEAKLPILTDLMWWKMCDFNMERPVPLHQADLTQPFVYERRWGVFHTPSGMHQGAMSLLLAFQHGLTDGLEVAKKLKLQYSAGTADYWLEHTEGAAFRSAVGRGIHIASVKGLSIAERRAFHGASCIFQGE